MSVMEILKKIIAVIVLGNIIPILLGFVNLQLNNDFFKGYKIGIIGVTSLLLSTLVVGWSIKQLQKYF